MEKRKIQILFISDNIDYKNPLESICAIHFYCINDIKKALFQLYSYSNPLLFDAVLIDYSFFSELLLLGIKEKYPKIYILSLLTNDLSIKLDENEQIKVPYLTSLKGLEGVIQDIKKSKEF